MGTDTPIAVLSLRPRLLFDYFQQLFAQVTNPPLDAIREEVVTAVSSSVGPEANLLLPGPESCRQLALPFPIIDNDELAKIIHANDDGRFPGLRATWCRACSGWSPAVGRVARSASTRSATRCRGHRRGRPHHRAVRPQRDEVDAPIPSLLLTSAVHHHLVRTKQRTKVGLVVECGDAREVHHMALPRRVRRRGDQPVPGVRVDRGPDRRRRHARPRRHGPARRPCATTSRPAARACSR
jgi:glutamate synthase (NADPH) large chain